MFSLIVGLKGIQDKSISYKILVYVEIFKSSETRTRLLYMLTDYVFDQSLSLIEIAIVTFFQICIDSVLLKPVI